MGLRIVGTGHYVPGEPISNAQLARVMDTSDDWIRQRTGIHQRHFVQEGQGVSDLALPAAKAALANAGVSAGDIDYILFATMTPEYLFPGSGGLLGSKLGIPGVPCLDVRQQCAAMPFSFQLADSLLKAGAASRILLASADAHAGFMPWEDWDVLRGESDRQVSDEAYARATRHRGVSVLFGDGAAAMVLSGDGDGGLLGADLHTDGDHFDHIYIPGGGFLRHPMVKGVLDDESYIPKMRGRDLFKYAVTKLAKTVETVTEQAGVTSDDVDLFVAHQANDRINDAVRKTLGVPEEKVPSNIARYGNTSAATIGILLDELRRDGRATQGQLVCFLALGAGTNWGSVLLRL